MPSRLEITTAVLEKLQPTDWNLDRAMGAWWHNQLSRGGLQLTITGYHILLQAGYDWYRCSISARDLVARTLVILDRGLKWPWALVRSHSAPALILFNSREATMMHLYGSFDLWLSYLDRSASEDVI